MSKYTPVILASIASSILLSTNGIKIIQDVKDRVPDIEFVVSSNLRGTDRQAAVLAQRLKSGKKLNTLYISPKAVLDELEAAYKRGGEKEIKKVLEDQQDRGIFMSKHMQGTAIDIYPYEGKVSMETLYKKLKGMKGYKIIYEGNHIHVQID